MTLSQKRLEQRLTRPFKYFDRVESTNDVAKAWLATGAPDSAVVIANEQTRGRGRKGRAWHTPPDSALALSIILQPEGAHMPRLNMVAALSVTDLVRENGCENVSIKWPNDVRLNGLKVSGVLPEAVWEGGYLQGAILGIGLNIRNDFSRSALRHSAISLEAVVGRPLDRCELIVSLLRRIDHWYRCIDSPNLTAAWKSRLDTLGQVVAVDGVKGVAVDVTADGALLIRDEKGVIHQSGAGNLVMVAAEDLR